MTERLPHPEHNNAARILMDAGIDKTEDFANAYNGYFSSLPAGHRHLIVAKLYAKPYHQQFAMSDELAAVSHRDFDYKAAARQLDSSNDTLDALHQVLHYNLGGQHPLVGKIAQFARDRRQLTDKYRTTLGMNTTDDSRVFNEIIGNLGPQFGKEQ